MPSPLNKGRWMAELELDKDREFLLEGIINGFELIPADSTLSPAEMDNHSSSTKPEARDKVEQTLPEEIAEGNYVVTPKKPTIASAISAVPNPILVGGGANLPPLVDFFK